ncbi:hypothetical protein VNO77_26012 [Canavalia gladiata]|uniref:Uncharacterized protein n=1 Tax=Canavalia gladiata TaxID=3824 RepID=A0AAN9Q9A1_CANGL
MSMYSINFISKDDGSSLILKQQTSCIRNLILLLMRAEEFKVIPSGFTKVHGINHLMAVTAFGYDHVCHWWGSKDHVSVDISNEMFHTTPIGWRTKYEYVCRHLAVFNGSIVIILNFFMSNCFDISILGDVGVKESWTKLFTVGPLPCVEKPIGVGKKGNMNWSALT